MYVTYLAWPTYATTYTSLDLTCGAGPTRGLAGEAFAMCGFRPCVAGQTYSYTDTYLIIIILKG